VVRPDPIGPSRRGIGGARRIQTDDKSIFAMALRVVLLPLKQVCLPFALVSNCSPFQRSRISSGCGWAVSAFASSISSGTPEALFTPPRLPSSNRRAYLRLAGRDLSARDLTARDLTARDLARSLAARALVTRSPLAPFRSVSSRPQPASQAGPFSAARTNRSAKAGAGSYATSRRRSRLAPLWRTRR
jgi:hypothetical protein